MFEFSVNLTNAKNGHVCMTGPSAGGMTFGKQAVAKVDVYRDEPGWAAKMVVLSRDLVGRGQTQELALYDLKAKVDEVFWHVHELRDEISQMATRAMIDDE